MCATKESKRGKSLWAAVAAIQSSKDFFSMEKPHGLPKLSSCLRHLWMGLLCLLGSCVLQMLVAWRTEGASQLTSLVSRRPTIHRFCIFGCYFEFLSTAAGIFINLCALCVSCQNIPPFQERSRLEDIFCTFIMEAHNTSLSFPCCGCHIIWGPCRTVQWQLAVAQHPAASLPEIMA